MIRNGNRYTKTVVLVDKFQQDTGNCYRVVGQRAYKGKPEANLPAGTTFTLQITEDNSEPIIDKKTGLPKDNNVFETFDVTVVGCAYPAPFKKGDYVSLDGFMEEASYYIDFNFILRFREIKKTTPPGAKKESDKP